METGISAALSYFERVGRPIDAALFPNIVRYEAKEVFEAAGQPADLVDALPSSNGTSGFKTLERLQLPNNGLLLRFGDLELRILKAPAGGGVPVAGPSRARQLWFQQLELFADSVDELRLLVIWDANEAGLLGHLVLVCPKRGAETRESLEIHWALDLAHPAELIAPTLPASREVDSTESMFPVRVPSVGSGVDVDTDDEP